MSAAIVQETYSQMQKSLEAFHGQLNKLQTGRASTAILEDLPVELYGNRVPLKQVANITVPEARQILVQPWDQGAINPIERAISTSNLGLNPRVEGRTLRVILPEVTEDRRKQLKKVIDEEAEKCRVQIRAHRQEGIKKVKAQQDAKALSEDESRHFQDEVQKKTDLANSEVEKIHAAKVLEVMKV